MFNFISCFSCPGLWNSLGRDKTKREKYKSVPTWVTLGHMFLTCQIFPSLSSIPYFPGMHSIPNDTITVCDPEFSQLLSILNATTQAESYPRTLKSGSSIGALWRSIWQPPPWILEWLVNRDSVSLHAAGFEHSPCFKRLLFCAHRRWFNDDKKLSVLQSL